MYSMICSSVSRTWPSESMMRALFARLFAALFLLAFDRAIIASPFDRLSISSHIESRPVNYDCLLVDIAAWLPVSFALMFNTPGRIAHGL